MNLYFEVRLGPLGCPFFYVSLMNSLGYKRLSRYCSKVDWVPLSLTSFRPSLKTEFTSLRKGGPVFYARCFSGGAGVGQ